MSTATLCGAFERAGLLIEAVLERHGDPAVESPTFRAYVLGRRAA
jgi:hypothetical protein